jgi:hypothetical protein
MKKLLAKIGTYEKDGEQKNRYVEMGVEITGSDGSAYLLMNPTVSLPGILIKQQALSIKQGKSPGENVFVSIFDNDATGAQQPQQQKVQHTQHSTAPPQNKPGSFSDDAVPF